MYEGYQSEDPKKVTSFGETGDQGQSERSEAQETSVEGEEESEGRERSEEVGSSLGEIESSEEQGGIESEEELERSEDPGEPEETQEQEDLDKPEESNELQESIEETESSKEPEEPPMSAEEFEVYCEDLKERIADLSQEEVDAEVLFLLRDCAKKDDHNKEKLLVRCNFIPNDLATEKKQVGQSPWVKVYRSLLNISKTIDFNKDFTIEDYLFEDVADSMIRSIGSSGKIDPKSMLQIVKDVMKSKSISSMTKELFMEAMTNGVYFSDKTDGNEYEAELLKSLDLENFENYAETAQILEALMEFFKEGHHEHIEDVVTDFYLKILKKVGQTSQANYLLSMRVQEIKSILEQSGDLPIKVEDRAPFELSKGVYVSDQVGEAGLMIIPEEQNQALEILTSDYEAVEDQLTPPQWMFDEAKERGERGVWEFSPQHLLEEEERLFQQMCQLATVPLEERLGELKNLDPETKEQMLFDYEYLVSRPMREMIQREFGFELKDLSIREQFYFLNYLKQITVAEADQMKEFTSQYGVKGMRTFLSLEQGGKTLGDNIVAFGEHEELAEKVFEYYSQLLDRAERAEELVQEISGAEGDAALELADQVYNNIVNRAQKDLIRAVSETDPSRVVDQVETYIAEAKEYVALLQEVGAGQIEETNSQELSEADKEQMKALLEANYSKLYPGPENEDFRQLVASSLEKSFANPETVFKVLRDKDKIVSYNRFDTVGDSSGTEVTYFASFNVDSAYTGAGGVMLEETVKSRLADGRPMTAHCDPEQSITRKYIEDGFVATNFYEVAGKPSFEIWRSQDSGEVLRSKNMSTEELLERTDSEGPITVRPQEPDEHYPELQAGRALTRYFLHEGRTYLVFEDLPESLRNAFILPAREDKAA